MARDGCDVCGRRRIGSGGTPICGQCIESLREIFGVKVVGKKVYYRIAPGKWVLCEWNSQLRNRLSRVGLDMQ